MFLKIVFDLDGWQCLFVYGTNQHLTPQNISQDGFPNYPLRKIYLQTTRFWFILHVIFDV